MGLGCHMFSQNFVTLEMTLILEFSFLSQTSDFYQFSLDKFRYKRQEFDFIFRLLLQILWEKVQIQTFTPQFRLSSLNCKKYIEFNLNQIFLYLLLKWIR